MRLAQAGTGNLAMCCADLSRSAGKNSHLFGSPVGISHISSCASEYCGDRVWCGILKFSEKSTNMKKQDDRVIVLRNSSVVTPRPRPHERIAEPVSYYTVCPLSLFSIGCGKRRVSGLFQSRFSQGLARTLNHPPVESSLYRPWERPHVFPFPVGLFLTAMPGGRC